MSIVYALLQQMAIILVIAYLFSKSPVLKYFSGDQLRRKDKLALYCVFSLLAITGTYVGLPVQGAIANIRAIGAVLAGLIGGPVLGVAVGLTAGFHRYLLGGFTAFSCGVSTTFEGLLGGLVYLYFVKRKQPDKVFLPTVALLTTLVAEIGQMLIILALSHPYQDALALVEVIAFPMISANAVGAAMFLSMIRDQRQVRDNAGARFSAKAFSVADLTLDSLSRGFNSETAKEMVDIIRQETGVGAVAITDREKILAFSGIGADHHLPGNPISTQESKQAIRDKVVVFADGFSTKFQCPISSPCLLGSALVFPLQVDQEVIGSISLYEPKTKLFPNITRSFGEGLATLYSHQLLRSRYEEQKSLLVSSELKLIQAQVNPHFLFNALNTIIAVSRKDAGQTRNLLHQLSNFFRTNLKRRGDMNTLEEELAHVSSYLKIEEARFGERLQVAIDVPPELLCQRLPVFTLQPLIENAIKHGIAELLDNGLVQIKARRTGTRAIIEIIDNAGAYREPLDTEGLGMKLVNKRIKNSFGADFGLEIDCTPGLKTCARVSIPFVAREDS
ncbi:sensor histidine kinase [Geopsychrobacter electrodiphilus]|uniref:sensor histidine kinase n=1 Tax=Geopsychrobacter electrodiphilus TaxID=225196 RepID=UPI00037FB43A|nr:sensor histidine kinase [Geopsychrobacter electrodiphilus]